MTLVCFFFVGATNLAWAAGGDSLTALKGLFQQVQSRVLDPSLDPRFKSVAIDQLFHEVDRACQAHCEVPLDLLRQMNSALESKELKDLIRAQFPEREKQILARSAQVEVWVNQIQHWLSSDNPELLKARIHASLELIRYLVRLREQEVFIMVEKGVQSKEVQDIIDSDREFLMKQGFALFRIGELIHRKNEKPSDLTVEEAKILAGAVDDLGLFYAKFIQSLSNNSLLFEEKIRAQFKHFQDGLEPIPGAQVREIIETELGQKLEDVFVELDVDKPFKSATIAQTYKARIKTWSGTKQVIVKVQRPNLESSLDSNSRLNEVILKAAKVVYPQEGMSPVLDIIAGQVSGFTEAVRGELDFRQEATHLNRARDFFRLSGGIEIPKPILRLTSKRVLVMELLNMGNIDTLLEADQKMDSDKGKMNAKIRERLFGNLLESFLYQTFIFGELHADLHPGNVLANSKGELGLIDWSQTTSTRGLVTDPGFLILAILRGDAETAAKRLIGLADADYLASKGLDRAVGNPVYENLRSLIQTTLSELELTPRSYKQLILGEGKDFDVAMQALAKIFRDAQLKHGFKVSSKYLQFVRSVLPISSTLTVLAREIPKDRLVRISAWKLAAVVLRGSFSAGVGATIQLGRKSLRKVKQLVQNSRVPRCSAIFSK